MATDNAHQKDQKQRTLLIFESENAAGRKRSLGPPTADRRTVSKSENEPMVAIGCS